MRVQTEEWRRFIPGSRIYKGKKTLFYNGEILWDDENEEYLIYDQDEQESWEVIIVLPGVEIIPEETFIELERIETVIMSDTVRRIEESSFSNCYSLVIVRLSRNLEYIGQFAFSNCHSLASIFIPLSCIEIRNWAFAGCKKLMILTVPQHTQLGEDIVGDTALFRKSSFEKNALGGVGYGNSTDEVNQWIKGINNGRKYSLHRICCSTYENEALPISEAIYQEIKEQGPQVLHLQNKIGITPLKYLEENPFFENIDEMKMLKRYILEKMGQNVH